MKIERVFEVEKETKTTVRYAEVAEGQPPVIGTIYVQKWAMKGIPKRVKVTLEVEDEKTAEGAAEGAAEEAAEEPKAD